MAKRKKNADALDGVKVTCDVCVSTASTPALDTNRARLYVAKQWGWVVTPTGQDLCSLCVKRGELKRPEYKPPKPKRGK